MDNLTKSDLYDGCVNANNNTEKVIDQQNCLNDQNDSPATEFLSSTIINDSYFEKVTTSLPKPVLKKMRWHIVKFPFIKDAHNILSPVLTDIFGHRIQLIFQWSNDEGLVRAITHKLNEATDDDLENWQKISFSISIGNKLIKTATSSSIDNTFLLGCREDIKSMLDGNDLILEFIISTKTVETSNSLLDDSEAKLTGKMVAFLILVLLLFLGGTLGSPETEDLHVQQDVTDIRKFIVNLNNNLHKVDLDTSRFIEILDNHSNLPPGINDAIELLQKSQRSYEKQLRKLDLILEALETLERRRNENIFMNLLNDVKTFLCNLSERFLPKTLQLASCFSLFD